MKLRRSREHNIPRRVQRRLTGILDNPDNKSNTNNLHSHIIRNSKQRACHRNQQQRTTRNTRSTTRTQRSRSRNILKSKTKNNSLEQNTDIVGIHQGRYRISHQIVQ